MFLRKKEVTKALRNIGKSNRFDPEKSRYNTSINTKFNNFISMKPKKISQT
jgi:hypothetical protein